MQYLKLYLIPKILCIEYGYWVWVSYQYPYLIPNTQLFWVSYPYPILNKQFFWVSNTVLGLGIGYGYLLKVNTHTQIFFVCECMLMVFNLRADTILKIISLCPNESSKH